MSRISTTIWAPSQYPKRRLFVRSRKVSKPRDLYLELSDRFEIWQARRQHCCRCACQISKRYGNLKYQSRGFETLRDDVFSDIETGPWSQRDFMGFESRLLDGQSMAFSSWFSWKSSLMTWVVWGGALSWARAKLFWKGTLTEGKRLCWSTRLNTCWFVAPPGTTNSFCQDSEIQPIRWQMDRNYHLFPAHKHQSASHPAPYIPTPFHLCDASWILTR